MMNTSHLQPNSKIQIWAYSKGNGIIPASARVYGTAFVKANIVDNFSSEFRYEIKRSEIKALDKPYQRCDSSQVEPRVAKCVEERFVEKSLNCSLRRLMSNPLLSKCNGSKLLSTFKASSTRLQQIRQNGKTFPQEDSYDIFWELNRLDEREIFEKTGCMPSCLKSKIKLVPEYNNDMINDHRKVARLSFVYPRGEYDLVEEYYIYNLGSFIADVGGYLGLLLGSSLLSMYHTMIPLVVYQIRSLAKKCESTKTES